MLLPKTTASEAFKATYRDDPVAFVHDCIKWRPGDRPTEYQDYILSLLVEKKRVCVRAPHGVGKSCLNAWAILWFSLTRDGEDWKAPTTASAWRQLTKFLWPEVKKWSRNLDWDKIGRAPFDTRKELLGMNLRLRTGEAFAVASDDPTLIEGAHADSLMFIYDESKSIANETFDATEGAFSNAGADTKNEAFALAMSTPGEPSGRFYDIQVRKPGFEDWTVVFVDLEWAIREKRLSRAWADQRAAQWGKTSAIYLNRCEGQFSSSEEDSLIPLSWVEAAVGRSGSAYGEELDPATDPSSV